MSNWNSIIISLYSAKYGLDENESCPSYTYRSLGNYDLLSFTPVSCYTRSIDDMLSDMWKKSNDISLSLEPGQSSKSLFAFDHTERAQYFWEEDCRYPYMFVSLIQTCNSRHESNVEIIRKIMPTGNKVNEANSSSVDELNELIKKTQEFGFDTKLLEEKRNCLMAELDEPTGTVEDIKYCIYTALDSCDLILCIKAKNYRAGLGYILKMNNHEFSRYIYSIIGMDLDLIGEYEDDEVIDNIGISAITTSMKYYDEWRINFKAALEKDGLKEKETYNYVDRLGDEDICVSIRGYTMKKLAKRLKEEDLFYPGPKDKFPFPRLRIILDSFEEVSQKYGPNDEDKSDSTIFSEFNCAKKCFTDHIYGSTQKALIEFITACQYLEKRNFAADTRACIGYFLPAVINQAMAYDSVVSGEDSGTGFEYIKDEKLQFGYTTSQINKIHFNRSIMYFVSGMRTIIDGTLNSDRMFFQVPGINAVLYDVPAKLLSFYTYFVDKVANVLDFASSSAEYDVIPGEIRYRFMLCPDLYDRMHCESLFCYNRYRGVPKIQKARVPVEMLFQPKGLMMELVHETAHAVGSEVRQRETRKNQLKRMIIDNVIEKLLMEPSETHDFEYANKLRAASTYLKEENNRELKEEILIFIEEYWEKEYKKYCVYIGGKQGVEEGAENNRANVEKGFKKTLDKLFIDKMWDLLGLVDRALKKKSEKEYIDINEDIRRLLIFNGIKLTSNELHNIVDISGQLLYESLADLIMIHVLRIEGYNDYLRHIHYIVEKNIFSPLESSANMNASIKVDSSQLEQLRHVDSKAPEQQAKQEPSGDSGGQKRSEPSSDSSPDKINIEEDEITTELVMETDLVKGNLSFWNTVIYYVEIFDEGYLKDRILAVLKVAFKNFDVAEIKLENDSEKASYRAFLTALKPKADILSEINNLRTVLIKDLQEQQKEATEDIQEDIGNKIDRVEEQADELVRRLSCSSHLLPDSAVDCTEEYLRKCEHVLGEIEERKKTELRSIREDYSSIIDEKKGKRIGNFVRVLKTANYDFIIKALEKNSSQTDTS